MSSLGLRLAPALAGGRLRCLNQVLWLVHRAEQAEARAVLFLDPAALTPGDADLWLLDAQGNPCRLPGPEGGRFTAASRAALLAAARDRMPGTAEAEPALGRLLPQAGEDPLAASARLWTRVLAPVAARVQVQPASPGAPAPDLEWLDPSEAPELTWLGPRHQQALRELGVPVELARQGEPAIQNYLAERSAGQTSALSQQMGAQLDAQLAALRAAIQEESPGLLGSWHRYRRASRKAVAAFQRATARHERNRQGIRGSRLHALAQGLRPHEAPQQDHLDLVCATALFRLDEAVAVEHRTVFHDPHERGMGLVFIGAGIS